MNFLAHAYLSFDNEQILVGNMISDFVKGKQKFTYPDMVQKGIQLHRDIDAFTDSHPATQAAKEYLRPYYRLYSGPMVDILYDHFLANDEVCFPANTLEPFTLKVYQLLRKNTATLPQQFLRLLPYMQMENWLFHYSTHEGIGRSLRGLVRRASFINDSTKAYEIFLLHYQSFQQCFAAFMPDVKLMAKQKFDSLIA